jgi:ribosomal subunit interface protein
MQVQINTANLKPTDAIVAHVHEKLERELKRFAGQVTRIEVHLRDDNANKGGIDKHCLLEARLAGLDPVVAEHTAGDMYLAIDAAAEKLQRVIEHRRERHRGDVH